ncbi:DUF2335 domain-containing protein [Vibrio vulnificus]|nr:DUF2335 domain-containing protein [Vibrio vulnificus]
MSIDVEQKESRLDDSTEEFVEDAGPEVLEKDNAQRKEILSLLDQMPADLLAKSLAQRDARHELDSEGGLLGVIMESVTQQSYSGPIPPPAMLHEYDQVQDGFANRIVTMAEKEQAHRHGIENRGVNGAISKDVRGQYFALICSLVMIVCCTYLISNGHEISGSILGGSTLVGLAYVFITGRKSKNSRDKDTGTEDKV